MQVTNMYNIICTHISDYLLGCLHQQYLGNQWICSDSLSAAEFFPVIFLGHGSEGNCTILPLLLQTNLE